MPSGDAQRTWFPRDGRTVTVDLARGMSMPALISLRDELDEMLQCIRAARNIRTPIITCRKCGMTGPAATPHVSVRALILALSRFEIASIVGIKPARWKRTGPYTVRIADSQAREKSKRRCRRFVGIETRSRGPGASAPGMLNTSGIGRRP